MHKVYLLFGSNEGERRRWLSLGTEMMAGKCGPVLLESSVYETAAWGLETQPDFLNKVVCIHTAMQPEELLNAVQETELALGRQREVKWGQRTLDIDILFFDNIICDQPGLQIPHPYITERRFTLMPLAEIAPDLLHPVLQKSMTTLLQECADPLPVTKL